MILYALPLYQFLSSLNIYISTSKISTSVVHSGSRWEIMKHIACVYNACIMQYCICWWCTSVIWRWLCLYMRGRERGRWAPLLQSVYSYDTSAKHLLHYIGAELWKLHAYSEGSDWFFFDALQLGKLPLSDENINYVLPLLLMWCSSNWRRLLRCEGRRVAFICNAIGLHLQ